MRYQPVADGEWVQPQRRGYKLGCCDCGLVHKINFRTVKGANGKQVIQFQPTRDKRATAGMRRGKQAEE